MTDLYCARCEYIISTAALTAAQKQHALTICREQGALYAVAHMYRVYGLSHREAKLLGMHFSPQPNQCHRCAYEQLESGETVCPKCKSVNLNWQVFG